MVNGNIIYTLNNDLIPKGYIHIKKVSMPHKLKVVLKKEKKMMTYNFDRPYKYKRYYINYADRTGKYVILLGKHKNRDYAFKCDRDTDQCDVLKRV